MKARVHTKNRYTFPTYTVLVGKEVIKAFYSRKEACMLRDQINQAGTQGVM
jgi:hypothetical protein